MISADKICKKFGKIDAVKDISFEVEKGEIVGFLGSNAAGKTTTMRILTCYFPPTSGSAKVAGFDIFEDSLKVRQNVGYLPENVPLYKDMPVDYFLDFVASLKGVHPKERDKKVEKSISLCGLEPVREQDIGQLSKGYRQRVGIAQAIINNPPILILDEPTVGLDPRQIIDIRNLIRGLGGNTTIILSSHILHEIEMVCDRILIIDHGKLLAYDTIENLAEKLSTLDKINLTVEGGTEAVKKILREIPDLTKLQDQGKMEGNIYKYSFFIPKNMETRRLVCKNLNSAGHTILEMAAEKMSTEEIFRKMVSRSEKDKKDPAGEEKVLPEKKAEPTGKTGKKKNKK